MKIKINMIDKDLKTMGRIMKVVNTTFTESRLRLMYKMSRKNRIKIEDDTMQFTQVWIPREDGSKLRICIFSPLAPKASVPGSMASSESKRMNQPGVLWFHGGGYVLGSPEQSKIYARRFIEKSNCVVVAPDYRLSIEAPYPAALNDLT